MSCLAVYKDCNMDTTHVSNIFIDEYMNDANDAQLKVYFYLLRMVNANLPTSMSAIAEKFNHTERDILRSLHYWEKKHLLSLDFNESKDLVGIHFIDFPTSSTVKKQNLASVVSLVPARSIVPEQIHTPIVTNKIEKKASYVKPLYTLEDMRSFKDSKSASELTFLAETYLNGTLTATDIQSLYFFVDTLKFSTDLVDFLLQYCAGLGKKRFAYIEKVAINWAENNITTVKEAKLFMKKYDSTVVAIMKGLGKSGHAPAAPELEYIQTWTTAYDLPMPIILEACNRTVLAVDTNRFKYAHTILKNWNENSVKTLEDVASFDRSYHSKKSAKSSPTTVNNKFNQFAQRSYDFDALEKELFN